jgi:hypothetical protein
MKARAGMIDHKLLAQSKWCKTEKKEKVNPKDVQMHQQSLDHPYCNRETSLTKLKNSKM